MGCCSTSVGALSILVIATAHPRSHSRTVQLDRRLTMMRFFLISSTHLSKLNRLCRGQALSSIVRYGLVDNGATIEAFPRIKHQKEIGESLQAHQPLAFGHSIALLPSVKSCAWQEQFSAHGGRRLVNQRL